MFTSRKARSYTSYQRDRGFKHRVWGVVRLLIWLLIAYTVVTTFLLSSAVVGSGAMQPTLRPGERILVSPLAYGSKLGPLPGRMAGVSSPSRGDLAMVEPPYADEPSALVSVAEAVVRFFTLQSVSLSGTSSDSLAGPVLKRIIALPGDTVRMSDYVLYVRPQGASSFQTEFDISAIRYEISRDNPVETWEPGFPLSDAMAERTLSENEYFVASDDRVRGLDSRHWGPVSFDHIGSKAILRYWPLSRFGSPRR